MNGLILALALVASPPSLQSHHSEVQSSRPDAGDDDWREWEWMVTSRSDGGVPPDFFKPPPCKDTDGATVADWVTAGASVAVAIIEGAALIVALGLKK